jgi:hypothetical protein
MRRIDEQLDLGIFDEDATRSPVVRGSQCGFEKA